MNRAAQDHCLSLVGDVLRVGPTSFCLIQFQATVVKKLAALLLNLVSYLISTTSFYTLISVSTFCFDLTSVLCVCGGGFTKMQKYILKTTKEPVFHILHWQQNGGKVNHCLFAYTSHIVKSFSLITTGAF